MNRVTSWLRELEAPTPGWIAPAASLIPVVPAIGRAQDYLTRQDRPGVARGVEVLGYHSWGWTFALVVVLLVMGVGLSRITRWPVVVAHLLAAGVHVSYVVALAQALDGSGRGVGVLFLPLGGLLAHLLGMTLYLAPRAPTKEG
jgi:hypothetical protein